MESEKKSSTQSQAQDEESISNGSYFLFQGIEFYDFPEEMQLSKYMVSKTGKIYGKARKRIVIGRIHGGYINVGLYLDTGEQKNFLLHRLVALKFLPNPDNLPTVDHIDRNRLNCHLSNLRHCSYSEQNKNRDISHCKGSVRPIQQFDLRGNFIKDWISIREASKFYSNKTCSKISQVCCGRKEEAFNFRWKYKPLDVIEDERWKEMENHPNYYISDYGRFKHVFGPDNEREHHPHLTACHYYFIKIEGEGHHVQVWVATAWIGPKPGPDYVVNHKYGDKSDNHHLSLEWCTQQENVQHAYDTGLIDKSKKGIVLRKAVYQYNSKGALIKKYNWVKEAMLAIGQLESSSIRSACTHRTSSAHGYLWDYERKNPNDDVEGAGDLSLMIPDPVLLNQGLVVKKPIYQYTLEKVFVRKYSSIDEVVKVLGKTGPNASRHILTICRGESPYAYGFIWKYIPLDISDAIDVPLDENKMAILNEQIRAQVKANSNRAKPVYQYDKDWNFIKRYSSSQEAAIALGKGKAAHRSIKAAASGYNLTSCGFHWTFKPRNIGDEKLANETKDVPESTTPAKKSPNCKAVYRYNKDRKFIKKYDSAEEAARDIEVPIKVGVQLIQSACRAEIPIAYDNVWSYRDLDEDSKENFSSVRIVLQRTDGSIKGESVTQVFRASPEVEEKKTRSVRTKAVYQYTLTNKFVKKHDSAAAAAIAIGFPGMNTISQISGCCYKPGHSCRNSLWSYKPLNPKDDPDFDEESLNIAKAVYQYTKDKQFIKKHKNTKEAALAIGDPKAYSGIRSVICNRRGLCREFFWTDKPLNPEDGRTFSDVSGTEVEKPARRATSIKIVTKRDS